MTHRERILRTVRFERPDYIPVGFHINAASWNHYPQEWMKEQMASHPLLFPGYTYDPEPVVPFNNVDARKNEPYTDDWGCLWETAEDGITGTVTKHPLADWSALDTYQPPDPEKVTSLGPIDWGAVEKSFREGKGKNLLAGGLVHGHTFLKICDIRGYENVLYDMMDEDPRLIRVLGMLRDFNLYRVKRFIDLGAEWIGYAEDLGMQVGPMISPDLFRKYIKPIYQDIMEPARKAGCIVHMHSDGDIRTLVDDLIDGGVEVINLQDLVNGIDWIESNLKGKYCIDLDIDRQDITPYGTPAQIDDLIKKEVTTLGSKDGGLMMIYGLYPGVPMKNVEALMDALEKYMVHFS